MNDNPDWNESRYFNFYDEKSDTTLFMRIGNKPNKNEKSMFLFVMREGLIAGMRASVPYDGEKLSCNGLSFKKKDDVWHISYNGAIADPAQTPPVPHMLKMDVVWNSINPVMNYRECVDSKGEELSKNVASEHFEQFGHVTGSVSIDGTNVDIDAYGERDESEGVRDWGSPKMWFWLNSVYGGKYGFNMTKLCTGMGDVDAGYFGDASKNEPIVKATIDTNFNGPIPTSYKMNLVGKNGKEYSIEGKILRYAMLPFTGSNEMLLIETISETTWNGMKGYGIAEFLVPSKKN